MDCLLYLWSSLVRCPFDIALKFRVDLKLGSTWNSTLATSVGSGEVTSFKCSPLRYFASILKWSFQKLLDTNIWIFEICMCQLVDRGASASSSGHQWSDAVGIPTSNLGVESSSTCQLVCIIMLPVCELQNLSRPCFMLLKLTSSLNENPSIIRPGHFEDTGMKIGASICTHWTLLYQFEDKHNLPSCKENLSTCDIGSSFREHEH